VRLLLAIEPRARSAGRAGSEEQMTSHGIHEPRAVGLGRVPSWVRFMSGIGIALAVAGRVLFGVTLLAFVGLLAAGLGLTEHVDAMVEGDLPSNGFDFDHDRS
jgi:hypothetical protein